MRSSHAGVEALTSGWKLSRRGEKLSCRGEKLSCRLEKLHTKIETIMRDCPCNILVKGFLNLFPHPRKTFSKMESIPWGWERFFDGMSAFISEINRQAGRSSVNMPQTDWK